jgi:hypothetical protein
LDEQAFMIGIDQGTLLVSKFELFFVLNHEDVTRDCPKREDLGRGEDF